MAKPKARPPKKSPKAGKTTASPASTQGERPQFDFRYADRVTKEDWAFKPSPDEAQEILEFICQMAELTWREIESQRAGGHKKHHDQPITSIAANAQADLQKRKLDEIFGDEIFRFRLSGRKRLWGFRLNRTFHVVFWDQDHKVCPTEPD